MQSHAPRERVSWNNIKLHFKSKQSCHAPRERVSWNDRGRAYRGRTYVTLHVSVWVEIPISITFSRFSVVTLHVSVWVEMIPQSQQERQLLSRSTWACELKYQCCDLVNDYMQSRSTWACELKWKTPLTKEELECHAPRERVSWNIH